MGGVIGLILAALVAFVAGGYSLFNGNVTGVAFLAFGLMLLALGIKQRSTITKKGDDGA